MHLAPLLLRNYKDFSSVLEARGRHRRPNKYLSCHNLTSHYLQTHSLLDPITHSSTSYLGWSHPSTSLLNDLSPIQFLYSFPYFQLSLPGTLFELFLQQHIGVLSTCHLLTASGKGKCRNNTVSLKQREWCSAEEILDSALFYGNQWKII